MDKTQDTGTFATQPRSWGRGSLKHFAIAFFGKRKGLTAKQGFWVFSVFSEDEKKALRTARIFFEINKFYEISEI